MRLEEADRIFERDLWSDPVVAAEVQRIHNARVRLAQKNNGCYDEYVTSLPGKGIFDDLYILYEELNDEGA